MLYGVYYIRYTICYILVDLRSIRAGGAVFTASRAVNTIYFILYIYIYIRFTIYYILYTIYYIYIYYILYTIYGQSSRPIWSVEPPLDCPELAATLY